MWVPGPREFRRVEPDPTLVDLRPLVADVSRQRLNDGWHLVASTPLEENAELYLLDLWARIVGPDEGATALPRLAVRVRSRAGAIAGPQEEG